MSESVKQKKKRLAKMAKSGKIRYVKSELKQSGFNESVVNHGALSTILDLIKNIRF